MSRRKQQEHRISGLFVFVLLGLFALFAMLMVLLGAQAYQRDVDRARLHNDQRIGSSYIRGKLRESDDRELLDPSRLEEETCLRIDNPREGTVTLLYVSGGYLYEWYTLEELLDDEVMEELRSGAVIRGEQVCPMEEMRIEAQENLLTVSLRFADGWTRVQYRIRSGT